MEITSPQNPRIMQTRQLRHRRGRQRQQRIVIDGERETQLAVEAGLDVEALFYCADDAPAGPLPEWCGAIASVYRVAPAAFEKIAYGTRQDGVVAVARPPSHRLDELSPSTHSMVAVLEALEKPGNLGAILRTADATGIAAVLTTDSVLDVYNPNAIRASRGCVFTVPICETSSAEALRWLLAGGFRIAATRVDGRLPYDQFDWSRGRLALVMGSESAGLSEVWNVEGVETIRLPMHGSADSLNVSATAAVLFYEALRQRAART